MVSGSVDESFWGVLRFAGEVERAVSADSTIARVHQHATNITRHTGESPNHSNPCVESPDHAIGRSRGAGSSHLAGGHGRPSVVLAGPEQAGVAPVFSRLM
ncbi:hypothetical protein GCM10022222_83080 [Amycolatopsis ultiminotia]|uniref:Uncharacterized protein n=1 Tax=Amycolatopsis ultiminotia TaxID=543629 RepID=A0ABP6YL46_9PSEU